MIDDSVLSLFPFLKKGKIFDDSLLAVSYLKELYLNSKKRIESSFHNFLESKQNYLDTVDANYPFIGVYIKKENLYYDSAVSYGVINEPGIYGTTITHPELFDKYYHEQIDLIIKRHNVSVIVGLSDISIPLPYILDPTTEELNDDQLWIIKNGFILPNLTRINDDIANSHELNNYIKPLSLFTAERIDYSLHRLHHYTGTSASHFQNFILLTNYQRYVDAFIEYGKNLILNDDEYTEFVCPNDYIIQKSDLQNNNCQIKAPYHLFQMPAYHLKRHDSNGITFINIGVGPSNAKNITDHLAVLRSNAWIMVGHCAGLRSTQTLGDYVLADGYVRDDNVLDRDVPNWVPIPPIAEIQLALQEAIQKLSSCKSIKSHARTGTVFTTDDRNWELRARDLYKRFKQSRAIAVDMESATIAANGFRFRVPYGTILCISDKPIHGEIKLQGMANAFYKKRVNQHLQISLEAINILRNNGSEKLHSRKLRGFDEPPFR